MTLVIKIVVILLFFLIFFALGSALYFLVSDKSNSDRIVRALTWRIALSILLFIFLFFAFSMGWIAPHSLFQ